MNGYGCHLVWAILICDNKNEQEVHHSNILNDKASWSFTTSTLRIAKRAGASPQQQSNLESEQQLHHSNIANLKMSWKFITAALQVSKRAGASPQQH